MRLVPRVLNLVKNILIKFGEKELTSFGNLKDRLTAQPVLSIYSPGADTELHCDASSQGFGSILLQRQSDCKMHPIFFFSKRSTEAESKYTSYHRISMYYLLILYIFAWYKI